MADDPEPQADREVLDGVGQQAAHNARDVAELEARLDTLTAALAEVLEVLREREASRADLGEGDAAAGESNEEPPRGFQ